MLHGRARPPNVQLTGTALRP